MAGHENRLNPDYVNQDEIDRVGGYEPRPVHHGSGRAQSRNSGSLHIVTTQSAPTTPVHNEKTNPNPSLSPRAQVQQVHSQVRTSASI